jgi:Putative Flp pilus-assembly TadE/G-like
MRTTSFEENARSERGAILVHVGISLFALMGFTVFVLDYGMMWLSRRQAQNAADAGALAGAIALAFDSFGDRTESGPAHQSALVAAAGLDSGGKPLNGVLGEVGGVHVDQAADPATWTTIALPPPQTCVDAKGTCVHVDVFRDGTEGSTPLPVLFAHLWGISEQHIRATATAQVRSANASDCVKPWMTPDKSDTETYTLADVGTLLILRDRTGPGQYQQADYSKSGGDLPCGGGCGYSYAITHCVAGPSDGAFKLEDDITNKPGRTNGMNNTIDVFNEDPGATWNPTTKSVQNSCAQTHNCICMTPTCANGLSGTVSPRLLAVTTFKPSDLAAMGGGSGSAPLSNILGFFLLEPGVGDPSNVNNAECEADPKNVCGYLTTIPGELRLGGGQPAQGGSLNVFVSLVR